MHGAETGRVSVAVFGGFHMRGPRGEAVDIRSRKARAVLAAIALSPHLKLTREKLCGLLWSEQDEATARTSLRQCLKLIRDAIPATLPPFLEASREAVSMTRERVRVDLPEVVAQAERGRFMHPSLANARLDETVLTDLAGCDAAFDLWLSVEREGFRRQIYAAMEGALRSGGGAQDAAARALVMLDPAHEEAARHLMRSAAAAGNVAEAQRVYEQLRSMLHNEYDARPSAETIALARSLATAPPVEGTSGGTSATPDATPVLLVESGALASGNAPPIVAAFVSDLTDLLTRFRDWRTIARSRQATAPTDVDYVLTLAPARSDTAVLLMVELVGQRDGRILMSSHVSLSDALSGAARQQIVRSLCAAMQVYVSESQYHRAGVNRPGGLGAIETLIAARRMLNVWRDDAEAEAERMIRQAIAEAPLHAGLHAGLADILNSRHIIFPGIFRQREVERRAMALARRAVALDPLDPACHLSHGWSLILDGRVGQAELAFQRAHQLNPAGVNVVISAAHGLAIAGQTDAALDIAVKAIAMHPDPPWRFHAFEAHIRYLAADYGGALAACEAAADVAQFAMGWRVAALGMLGSAEARNAGEEFLARLQSEWVLPDAPSADLATHWFIGIFPYGRPEFRDKLCEGLSAADLPITLRDSPFPPEVQRQKLNV
jgi:DNA-binding SARP family transcriptional activator/Tfp pilus assembly protein PilF